VVGTLATAALALQPLLASPAGASGASPSPSPSASVVVPSPTPSATPSTAPGIAPLLAPPSASVSLPATTDVLASYQGQRSCDPAAKPGVEAYVRMLLRHYRVGRSGGIVRGCGIGSTSEHKEGRAFDYMLSINRPAEKAAADSLTTWLTGPDSDGVIGGNARRLGIMYVIWNRRIWSTYALGTGWKPYRGPNPHTDHIHTSFSWDGAMRRTSFWSGRTVSVEDRGTCRVYQGQPAPVYVRPHRSDCPTDLPPAPRSAYSIVWPGQSSSTVRIAQNKLGMNPDGVFGGATRTILMSWQRRSSLPVTGVLDKPTWARLAPTPLLPPLPTPPPPATTPPPTAPPATAPPATAPPATAPTPSAETTMFTQYRHLVLSTGARGAAVVALQRGLRLSADGVFGRGTAAAVRAAQQRGGLPATGVVDAATWTVVTRLAYPLLDHRSTTLRRGSSGASVTALQQALRLTADGRFGAATHAAVMTAQTAARLVPTGVVDRRTWVAVEAQAYPLSAPAGAAAPVRTAPVRTAPVRTAPVRTAPIAPTLLGTSVSAHKATVLRPGASGPAVRALQRALGIGVDGRFGRVTAATVKAFQKARTLPVTGIVDRRTWTAVELVAHPLVPHRRTVLKVGSRGAAVAAVQKALKLQADGAFGAKTRAAVAAAQTKGKLAPTGTVDVRTWVSIEKQVYPLGVKRW
jgi:peptidoglycan hydrolase-like protein with peptidoglycan-binding domain